MLKTILDQLLLLHSQRYNLVKDESVISCRRGGGGMVLGIGSKSTAWVEISKLGAGCQGGIADVPLGRIYGVLLK